MEPRTEIANRLNSAAVHPGIVHRAETYDLWLAFVSDLDGNQIGMMREAPKGLDRG